VNARGHGLTDALEPALLEALAGGERSDASSPEPRPIPARGDVGAAVPFPLTLLPPALQSAVRAVARFNKIPEASPALVGVGTLATAIGKRALVLHVAAEPGVLRQPVSEIDADTWAAPAAAHGIGLWFLDEAVRVQRTAVEDLLLETARRTLAWLGRRDEATVTTRTLSLYGPRPRPDAKTGPRHPGKSDTGATDVDADERLPIDRTKKKKDSRLSTSHCFYWPPIVGASRTICITPTRETRTVFEAIRQLEAAP
jgi:hypothetical protein